MLWTAPDERIERVCPGGPRSRPGVDKTGRRGGAGAGPAPQGAGEGALGARGAQVAQAARRLPGDRGARRRRRRVARKDATAAALSVPAREDDARGRVRDGAVDRAGEAAHRGAGRRAGVGARHEGVRRLQQPREGRRRARRDRSDAALRAGGLDGGAGGGVARAGGSRGGEPVDGADAAGAREEARAGGRRRAGGRGHGAGRLRRRRRGRTSRTRRSTRPSTGS